MIYCYPKLSDHDLLLFRCLGPGLGNLLFPWARALVFARRNRFRFIEPTWPQIKIGTLLRREIDSRSYFGLFRELEGSVIGAERILKLTSAKRVQEQSAELACNGDVVEFTGMQGLFVPIAEDHRLVRDSLVAMTRSKHKGGLKFDFSSSISVHVRLGDFAEPAPGSSLRAVSNTRIPIDWYADIVEGIRRAAGATLPAYIFSDGTDSELATLLSLPKCSRLGFGSAIADLLALSRANILVTSGSTFSMWASFLGRMPALWYPGRLRQRFYSDGVPEDEVANGGDINFDPNLGLAGLRSGGGGKPP